MKRFILLLAWLAAWPGLSGAAPEAADFPSRPIRIVAPFSAGSGADQASRFFGDQLARVLGQPVVVENRTGAGGILAVNTVRTAPADGHTMLMGSNSLMSVNPVMLKDLPYDPLVDFRPVGGLTRGVNAIVVADESPYRTLTDLVAAAKPPRGALNAGTYALGYELALGWLGNLTGAQFQNIAYKGAGEIFTALRGGHLDFGILSFNGAVPQLKSGKFRALALSSEVRSPEFPDVPTVAELGYPEFKNYTWTSFFVRADTPDAIVQVLAEGLQKVLSTQAAKDYAGKELVELLPLGPEAMRSFQRDEIARFGQAAAAAGIKPR